MVCPRCISDGTFDCSSGSPLAYVPPFSMKGPVFLRSFLQINLQTSCYVCHLVQGPTSKHCQNHHHADDDDDGGDDDDERPLLIILIRLSVSSPCFASRANENSSFFFLS